MENTERYISDFTAARWLVVKCFQTSHENYRQPWQSALKDSNQTVLGSISPADCQQPRTNRSRKTGSYHGD